ncbi:MAG: alpha-ketoglutarate-dependent dioxygenase AlkB [Gammaproteobacteria bacterium]|nr:alpha-ketoglutarate-dependent dioxygenase AlkB [Gammaproteobacteria bacterium]
MDLFDYDPLLNLLPYDGELNYFSCVLSHKENDHYLKQLLNTIKWKNDEVIIYGKHITTKRKVAWYGDSDYAYTYSNTTKNALSWTKDLLELKSIVEKNTNTVYNSCLLNLYHNGEEAMGWHSDDEATLDKNASIASLSFGAQRKFSLKHKLSRQTISLTLEAGSLLVMKGSTQSHWVHSLPKMRNIQSPRVNLTFRTFK